MLIFSTIAGWAHVYTEQENLHHSSLMNHDWVEIQPSFCKYHLDYFCLNMCCLTPTLKLLPFHTFYITQSSFSAFPQIKLLLYA